MAGPRYRADIDGLRGIAILSVVGFHFFPAWFPGGFTGVDIFFVISGFLISTLILAGLRDGSFRFSDFYSRRIRRIFPALVLVLVTGLVLGWNLLFAHEYMSLGKQVAGGAGFVSNFLLWLESGYFDVSTDSKPFLHLWSLAVEEQYYIIGPPILFFVWKRKWSFLGVISCFALGSFVFNLYETVVDPVAAFYLPLSRLWEIAMGGVLAVLQFNRTDLLRDRGDVISWSGLALVLLGFFLIGKESLFPGWWALFPTTGAFCLILSGNEAWVGKNILSQPWLVKCGLISYPLYLWHWLLLSMARIVGGEVPSLFTKLVVLVVSVFLAWVTYRFVERPIRSSQGFRHKTSITWMLVLSLVSLGLIGFYTFLQGGLGSRKFVQEKRLVLEDLQINNMTEYICPAEVKKSLAGIPICKSGAETPSRVALVGDSHAGILFPAFQAEDSVHPWLLLAMYSCPPVMGVIAEGPNSDCGDKFSEVMKYLANQRSVEVVVLSFFGQYANDTTFAADLKSMGDEKNKFILAGEGASSRGEALFIGLSNTIGFLRRAGKKVVLTLDVPELPFQPLDCIRRAFANLDESCHVARKVIDERQVPMRRIVARLRQNYPDLLVYDPLPLFCDTEKCHAFHDNRSNYRDSHHLSGFGSQRVGVDFNRWWRIRPK